MENRRDFICPNPERWKIIFETLCREYEKKYSCKLPSTVVEIRNAGGPPTPLVLNGWVFSSDLDKALRFTETIHWAEKHGLSNLISVEEKDKCYSAGYGREESFEDAFTRRLIQRFNLQEHIKVSDYRNNPDIIKQIPNKSGIYFIFNSYAFSQDDFLETGTGGFFKGKNPNVSKDILQSKWVGDARILYIGKAGGVSVNGHSSRQTLRTRVKSLLDYGNHRPVAHWGGRYIWQCSDSDNFEIYWYSTTEVENATELERELITEFTNYYNKLPFANLR